MRTPRHKRRGNGDRSFQPGKGSSERSSEWRKYYDEVDWRRQATDGFEKRGGRLIKRYGTAETKPDNIAPAAIIH